MNNKFTNIIYLYSNYYLFLKKLIPKKYTISFKKNIKKPNDIKF